MKYFLQLMYDGQAYAGWQRQPNVTSVQAVIEDRMSRMLQTEVAIMGCGRTDSGVHALDFFAHTVVEAVLDDSFLFRLNNFLPRDVAIIKIWPVHEEAHARFDATERSYIYHIHFHKNPFREKYSFYYRRAANFSLDTLNEFSQKLTTYEDFQTFAKVHSDVNHHRCQLSRCEWQESQDGIELHITSNRFLRGMVRLITGASLRYAEGRITMEDLERAMSRGEQIKDIWSVPAHGLFLSDIRYPYIEKSMKSKSKIQDL